MQLHTLSPEDFEDASRRVILVLGPQILPSGRPPRLEMPENMHGVALLRIAQGFLDLATFRTTGHALGLITEPEENDLIPACCDQSCGWCLFPLAVPFDLATLIVCVPFACAFGTAGGIIRGAGSLFSRQRGMFEDAIFASSLLRFHQALTLLCATRCETPITIRESFDAGRPYLYYSALLLLTAFQSRGLHPGWICLASGHVLHEEDCPPEGRRLFGLLEQLKYYIGDATRVCDGEQETAAFVVHLLPALWDAMKGGQNAEIDHATALGIVVKQLDDLGRAFRDLPIVQRGADKYRAVTLRIPFILSSRPDPPPYHH